MGMLLQQPHLIRRKQTTKATLALNFLRQGWTKSQSSPKEIFRSYYPSNSLEPSSMPIKIKRGRDKPL